MRARRFLLLPLLLVGALRTASAQEIPLDRKQSSVTFVGQAFLHSFRGEAKALAGQARLSTGAMPPLQRATLRFQLSGLTTFNSGRDQKMFEWLEVTRLPEAVFELESVRPLEGETAQASAAQPARFQVVGSLTLHGRKQKIEGSARGWREKDRLLVTGEVSLDTLSFGLPRIRQLMMTVDPNVKVTYRLAFVLPANLRAP